MKNPLTKWCVASGRIVAPAPNGDVWIIDEDHASYYRGLDAELLTTLDDTTTAEQLSNFFSTLAGDALQRLKTLGVIQETQHERDPRKEAAGLPPPFPFAWKSLTDVGRDALASLFQASGFELDSAAPRVLVTTDDYLSRELLQFAATEKRPWLLARTVGRGLIIGPAFNSGGVCWGCLAYWLRARRWLQAAVLGRGEQTGLPQPAVAATPAFVAAAIGHLTIAMLRWGNGSTEFDGRFRYFDLPSGSSSQFELTPRASCGCAPPKRVSIDNWANPVTGIVFDLSTTPGTIGGMYQLRANHLRPFPNKGPRPLLEPGTVYGSGSTAQDGRTRCIAEGLERWSSIWHGDEKAVICHANELERVVLPNHLNLHSDRQLNNREEWNRQHLSLFHVPVQLDLNSPLEWAEFRSFGSSGAVHVPAASSYMWHTSEEGTNFGFADSNGCAAGQTMDDAILGALLELVERDAVAIWWDNRLLRPAVDWEDFGDRELLAGVEDLRRRGRMPVLLDLTTDIGIPVYAAVGCREDGSQPYAGCAAHVNPLRAAKRAFAELIQNWFWSSFDPELEALHAWSRDARPETHAYLHPQGRTAIAPVFEGNVEAALAHCLTRLAAAGLEAHWLDTTRPDIGLPVCRVIAPGLRHCWMRHAPGRLFDVPVKMGWLQKPLTEDELNPEGCPL